MAAHPSWVVLGRITGVFGVRGAIKVHSYTDPQEAIFRYPTWWLRGPDGDRHYKLNAGRRQGRGLVASLDGIEDRDAARTLIGRSVAVPRSALPETGGYYWADLIGLEVQNRDGVVLGQITGHIPTGGHDVMVVLDENGRERLIPWALGTYVDTVRLDEGRVVVDWHPED